MTFHYAESIAIITATEARGQAIKASVSLRGFDRIKVFGLSEVLQTPLPEVPDLIILDPEGQTEAALSLLKRLPNPLPMIYLAEAFDEELFLTCYDAGAKDFLVKPVNSAYLISRVLFVLDEQRLQDQLAQRDAILQELSVIGSESSVFTAPYFLKMIDQTLAQNDQSLHSLLVLEAPGLSITDISQALKRCCRASDLIGELGASQFALFLPNSTLEAAQVVASRLQRALAGSSGNISIGLADSTEISNAEALLAKAKQ